MGQLATAFDDMVESLEKHQTQQRLEEELRRQKRGIGRREPPRPGSLQPIEERIRVPGVARSSRTPLTAISGYLDLLLEAQGAQSTAKQRELLGIVQRNTERLVKLIDDLLDLSRIESGKVEAKNHCSGYRRR